MPRRRPRCKSALLSGPEHLGSRAVKALPADFPQIYALLPSSTALRGLSSVFHSTNTRGVKALKNTISTDIPGNSAVQLSSICREEGEGTESESHLVHGYSAHHWPYINSVTRAQEAELGLQAVPCPRFSK
jgi:hypothetical protein